MNGFVLDELDGMFDSDAPPQAGMTAPFTMAVFNRTEVQIRSLAGGGGGGAGIHGSGLRNYGAGGRAGTCVMQPYTLQPGTYLVSVGIGGAGGRNNGVKTGRNGEDSFVQYQPAGEKYALAIGGRGGAQGADEAGARGQGSVDEDSKPLSPGTRPPDDWNKSSPDARLGAGGGGASPFGGGVHQHGGKGGNGRIQIIKMDLRPIGILLDVPAGSVLKVTGSIVQPTSRDQYASFNLDGTATEPGTLYRITNEETHEFEAKPYDRKVKIHGYSAAPGASEVEASQTVMADGDDPIVIRCFEAPGYGHQTYRVEVRGARR